MANTLRAEHSRTSARMNLRSAAAVGFGYLVDDALHDDGVDVDAAGDVGDEFGDEVVGGCEGEVDSVARCAGVEVGGAAGDVEIGDLVVDGVADQVVIVDHAFAVVALRPDHLQDGVADAVLDGFGGLAVVVRVLVGNGCDEEGAKEFAGDVLRVGDADAAPEAGEAWAVGRVGVGGDADGGGAEDGDGVERVSDVADGEPGFFFRGKRLDFGAVGEAGVPVDEGQVGGARNRHPEGLVCEVSVHVAKAGVVERFG